jgi:hypothetical protein
VKLCDVKFCFRLGRFPVEGTIWHACYRHHPTSPLGAPSLEQIHHDWQEVHPEFVLVSLGCETDIVEEDEEALVFGFYQSPKKKTEAEDGPSDIV